MTDTIDLSGRSLGDYELKARIGQGGMADVYLAARRFASEYERPLERQFAVKILFGAARNARRRFEQEMAILLRLNHTNIIRVYDYAVMDGAALGLAEPFRYFVMDYLDGGTLYDRIKHGRLSAQEFVEILRVVANALDFAHAEGIIHRDIKPGNVLFDRAGNPVLADFGISKLGEGRRDSDADITSDGFMLGTPPYLAPEAFHDEPLDWRADLYSFGVVTFFALAGRLPFEAPSVEALLAKVLFSDPPYLSEVNPAIPPSAADAVRRMLAKAPEDRFASAGEFIRALERGLGDLPLDTVPLPLPTTPIRPAPAQEGAPSDVATPPFSIPARLPAGQSWRSRRRWLGAWAAVGMAALLVVGAALARGGGSDDPPGGGSSVQDAPTLSATPAALQQAPATLNAAEHPYVTNAAYRHCAESGGCTAVPAYAAMYGDPLLAEQPVVGIDWFAAVNYCLWRGERLPALAEWPDIAATSPGGASVREWLIDDVRRLANVAAVAPATVMPVRETSVPDRAMSRRADEIGADLGFRCVPG